MPDLPTFTVTSAQAQRIIEAFGSQAAYRRWLRQQVIQFVVVAEQNASKTALEAEIPETDPGPPPP